jgi:uncharacterized protein with gpF-like domain
MPYLTGLDPRREWRAQSRLALGLERMMLATVQRELERTQRDASEAYEAGLGIGLALAQHTERMERIYASAYQTTGEAFGGRMLQQARKGALSNLVRKDAESEFMARLRAIIAASAGRAIVASETTQDQLRAIIEAAVSDGMSQRQVAAQIRNGAPDLPGIGFFTPRVRGLIIARTEVHTAQVQANDAAAREVGGVERKEWVAAEDERTRETHRDADGQVVALDGSFIVGETRMGAPGEFGAPAAEVVNCRCAVAYPID